MQRAERGITMRDVGDRVDPTRVGADGVPTLVFDGDCGFCTASARWIAGRWPGPGRAVPYQQLDRASLDRLRLSAAQVADAAWWVDERGSAWRGHLAIARSMAAAGGWWGTAGRALLVPPLRWLGAAVYPMVARHRHRLPGATPACQVPGNRGV